MFLFLLMQFTKFSLIWHKAANMLVPQVITNIFLVRHLFVLPPPQSINFINRLFVQVIWYINLCRLFNAKSIFIQTIQFSISTQFVKNISISSNSVQSNSFNSNNSVQYKYRFYLYTVKCQNSSILKYFFGLATNGFRSVDCSLCRRQSQGHS